MVGVRIWTNIGQVLGEASVAICVGLTVTSLVVGPVAAADLTESTRLDTATAKSWNEPLSVEQKILHLLNRITFGPRPGDAERVRQIGLEAFLEEQFHPERIADSAVEARIALLPTLSMSTEELVENFPPPKQVRKFGQGAPAAPHRDRRPEQPLNDRRRGNEMQSAEQGMMSPEGPRRVLMELAREGLWRAVYSNRQLQEVMVQFWMNHFNIFAPKGADKWLMTSYERDAIRPQVLGKFEDLLVATAKSPAMLFYLDNWMSTTPNPTRPGKAAPTWRRQRAFSRPFGPFGRGGQPGVWRPFGWPSDNRRPRNPNGRAAREGGLKQNKRGLNENYAREIMELHTLGVDGGYTQRDVIEVARCFTGWTIDRPRQGGEFIFNPRMHDFGQKVVLRHKIRSGRGMEDGLEVLHLLAHQAATGHFISLKLCRRFIADDPPQSVVERASQAFLRTDGDIRAVLKTIFTSPEFYSQAAFQAKVKSPLELVASSLRALNADTDADVPLLQFIARMGQPMFQYQAPTGFPDRADTWISSNTLLTRLNFATMLATNRIRGTQVDFQKLGFGDDVASSDAIVEKFAGYLVGGSLSPETRQAILKSLAGTSTTESAAEARPVLSTAATLLLASPEFQRR